MSEEEHQLSVDDVFSLLSERFEGYEKRSQQLKLSQLIRQVFDRRSTGIFEAGTGIGKSLAALIPAVLSGKKVVVSTATIALQEQYINKDIPSLQAILPFQMSAALMKGRGNYLGLRRWEDHILEEAIDDRLVDWVSGTTTGDMSELDFLPPTQAWSEVNSDSDDCLRNKCPRFNSCFYFAARRKAEEANILVVNHSLLLADAASFGNVLPQYHLVIIDEAQHLPDIARDAFSASVSRRGLSILTARSAKRVNPPSSLVRNVEMEGDSLFNYLSGIYRAPKARIKQPVQEARHLRMALETLGAWLEKQKFEDLLDVDMAREKAKLKAKALISTIKKYVLCLTLLEESSEDWVVWIEQAATPALRLRIVAAPLDVSRFIKEFLLSKDELEASVWMSATLAAGGTDPFAYFKDQTGIAGSIIQEKIDSPFDYARQSVLYLPAGLPAPNDADFAPHAWSEIARLIQLSRGRAFVLFTSYQAMNRAFEELAGKLSYPCMRQGEMPRARLLQWFTDTGNAVLFGTASFWEGVSIDGDALSLVIIDRIPFQVPDDPVYEAQCEALEKEEQGAWFTKLALPHATMRLKQGVGRLIRTSQDRGMVAILDPRLTQKSYGRMIIDCLPPMRIIQQVEEIETLEEAIG